MTNRKLIVGSLGLLVLFAIGYHLLAPNSAEPEHDSKNNPATTNAATATTETAMPKNESPAVVESSAPKEEKQTIIKIAPRPDAIRTEVAKDPHHTPSSILAFAAELGEKMEAALQSPETAPQFFTELQDCVSEQSGLTTTVRAICLSNAKHLAKEVPSLQDQYQNLQQTVQPEVSKLVHE